MNRYLILFLSLTLLTLPAFAQDEEALSSTAAIPSDDTEANVDSLLVGYDIFSIMPSGVFVSQSPAVRRAMEDQVAGNEGKKFNGFRVRIFLSSAQNARAASSNAYSLFCRLYPDIPAYRVYDSPNFRVTVGNFRTRLEADAFAKSVKRHFPSASVMRERFKYPTIGHTDMAEADTLEIETLLF